MRVDLNSDLGEGFGAYKMGLDDDIIPLVSSINIACGFHAGDPCIMHKTIRLAKRYSVSIGAHPSYPDLLGFGRRNLCISTSEAMDYTLYQLGALFGFVQAHGLCIQHVKPHGALYNMAATDYQLALALCEAVAKFDDKIIFLGLYASEMANAAKRLGLRYANEVFADRAYNDDGTLVSRSVTGALIDDEHIASQRVLSMVKNQKVTTINNKEIAIKADSICIHGDNLKAIKFAQTIRESLESEGVEIIHLQAIAESKG